MQWFPDPELEKYIREIARLPEMTDEDVDYKRTMLAQQQAMEYGQSQMDLLGMSQKADMTAQGMTPEQAQMHSETPAPETADMQAQQAQQQSMATNMPPPEDPNAGPQHQREKEKMQLADKTAQSAHSRDKEKMRLQDTMSNREHKRSLEALRHKDRSAATNTKLKLQQQKAAAKQGPSKVPTKFPAKGSVKKLPAKKTTKKLPPKKR